MNVTPLALHSTAAVRGTLRSHGWEDGLARASASGISPLAFHLTGLDPEALEALVRIGGGLGLEVVTGDGWAILAGSRSRLSAFARPWTAPGPLTDVALRVGLAMPAEPAPVWRTARGAVPLDRPIILGILNVTPDSFSDGGRYTSVEAALAHAELLLSDGATMIDVGGESTRPGRTESVAAAEELKRVVPVVETLVRRHSGLMISVDTVKSEVARATLDAGAAIVNDVSAFRLDPAMAGVAAGSGAGVILMHSRGGLLEISSYDHADYAGDIVGGTITELRESLSAATAAGIEADTIVLDPGLGFSKTVEQSLELFDQLGALQALGRPLLVGPSRKRFLGAVTGLSVEERDRATAAACALAWERGARLFRVHAVAAAREALALAQALDASPTP
ncbi:MAG TPA: dihydropteroate synthase [Gemmatimonadales bacterium]|nr:dihydropteroate synthase [Gemmatimonadales bacterium]